MTDVVVSIQVIPFSGKGQRSSSLEQTARAIQRSYQGQRHRLVTDEGDTPASSNATDAEKARFEELKQANKQGCIDLVLSIDGNSEPGCVAFAIIKYQKGLNLVTTLVIFRYFQSFFLLLSFLSVKFIYYNLARSESQQKKATNQPTIDKI